MSGETIIRTHQDSGTPPALSIVSPTFRFDPKAMLDALAREAAHLPVELVVIDDGSGDPALADSLKSQIAAFPAPATLILLHQNAGRAAARNRLIREARAPYLLFLDSDMLPDAPDFLSRWLALIENDGPDVAYGGFSTRQAPDVPEHRLSRALAQRWDCQDAAGRTARGGIAVATSNLLVRADVIKAVPFDHSFKGWGWEDAEWALRAARSYRLLHVDNTATHLGFDPPAVILRKYAEAGANFVQAARLHPQVLATPSGKMSASLSRVPGPLLRLAKPVLANLVKTEAAPIALREQAARLWRAVHAGESLQGNRA